MISKKFHALYQVTKGGIKTACVEFVEFEGSDQISVTSYKLKGSNGLFSLLPTGRPEYFSRDIARKIWSTVKEAGYRTIA